MPPGFPSTAARRYLLGREMEHDLYKPYTEPHALQGLHWDQSKDLASYGAFWEQGTGKSKFAIDTIGHLWTEKQVTGAIVVAPNGVHRNWVSDELPKHMSPDIPLEAFAFKSESSSAVWHKNRMTSLLSSSGLPLLAISYDAWMTDLGKKAVWNMMRKRRCILVLDESHRIKTPSIKRTRSILAGGRHAPFRRVLSGTPATEGPFDLYSQIKFLDDGFWKRELQIDSFTAFKAFFGIWEQGWNNKVEREYDILAGYQNLDVLAETIKKISSRITKEEALDLPPKLYTKRYYELTPRQRQIYEELEAEFVTWLDNGEMVTAPLAVTRMLRLQQVLCGYLPADGASEPTELIDRDKNPRLKLLADTMEDVNGKTIIWATWTKDIDLIMDMLKSVGRRPVRYDGKMSGDARERSKNEFKKGDATDFVANSSMSEGLTLNEAKTTIYYNNSYKLIDRKQTEDRNHRHGQDEHVLYIDLICPGTRDEHAIEALVKKDEVAATILGDKLRSWI